MPSLGPKRGVLALALLAAPRCASCAVVSNTVELPGRSLRMEYALARASAGSRERPPIVFCHGTFHGSWCFAEHWLEHFSERGYDTYAVSLRGTSASPEPVPRKIGVDEHVDDLATFVREVVRTPPTLVGHSFGGAYVQKLLERGETEAAACVLLCSVPPSGNVGMTMRFLRRAPLTALRITRAFVAKTAATSIADASSLFFSDALPENEVRRYMERFAADSKCTLDVADFTRKLPSRNADSSGKRAAWAERCPPMLVLGAELDSIVDARGVEETAEFYGAEHGTLAGIGHDVMLVPGWESVADRVADWLDNKLARPTTAT